MNWYPRTTARRRDVTNPRALQLQQSEHELVALILQIDDVLALLPEDEQQAYRDAQQSVIDARRHAEANEGMRMIW